jgi:anti-anti-sigma factor
MGLRRRFFDWGGAGIIGPLLGAATAKGGVMNPEVRTVDDVVILTPKGLLLGGKETEDLEAKIEELDETGNSKLLLNMGKAEFISSVGLAVLFRAYTKYVNRGATVKICSADKRIHQIFVLVRLTLVYGEHIHQTEEEALAGFRAMPCVESR